MAIQGSEVADAYVSVNVDTSQLSPAIRRAARQAGQKFAKDFSASSGREMDVFFSKVGREMQRSFSISGRESGTEFMDGMKAEIESRMRNFDLDLGRAVVTGDWAEVLSQFDDFDDAVIRVQRRLVALQEEEKKTGFTQNRLKESLESLGLAVQNIRYDTLREEAEGVNREFDRQADITRKIDFDNYRDEIRAVTRDLQENSRAIEERIDKDHELALSVRKTADEMNASFDRQTQASRRVDLSNVRDQIADLTEELEYANLINQQRIDTDHQLAIAQDAEYNRTHRLWRIMRDFNGEVSWLGNLRGSRNDFIHGIGIVAGVTERAVGRLVDRILEIPAGLERLGGVIQANGGGITGFFSAMGQQISGFADSADELIIKLVGMALIMQLTIGPMGAMVAMLTNLASGLAGIAVALAGSAFYALSGAILALGPGLHALAAGVGAVVTAFTGLDGELDSVVKPVTEWFNEVKRQVREAIFPKLSGQIEGLTGALSSFVGTTLVSSAEAFSRVIDNFVTALARPEVQTTLDTLSRTLPPILENLGKGFSEMLLGLLGFFAPISEQVVGLSGGFADVMAHFAEWANSETGREEIKQFFTDAVESMKQWGDLIGPLSEALFGLFTEGKETGDSFVESLGKAVETFLIWIGSEEGRERLAQWFRDAKRLASDLANVIQAVGDMIGRLDTKSNRQALSFVLTALTDFINIAKTIWQFGSWWFSPVINSMGILSGWIKSAVGWLDKFISNARALSNSSVMPVIRNGATGAGAGSQMAAARGMLLTSPTNLLAGEDGPEAVVPLNRPLSQVDPSVRALSAFAQGKGLYGESRSITIHEGAIQIANGADPYITAVRVTDGLAAMAY